ncbi:MAG: 7-carboxy-7-deazaguanine synthase QueE [Pseudomonadota bacterium]
MRLATITLGTPEIFAAPQGEGPSAGEDCVFVRLSQCNLHCVWCDTPYTWNFQGTAFAHRDDRPSGPSKYDRGGETVDLTVDQLARQLMSQTCRRLVITGGEPLLQQGEVSALCAALKQADPGWTIEIETNGTIRPRPDVAALIDQFNVSPKLAHSGNASEIALKPAVLAWYASEPSAVFKFVVAQPGDLEEVERILAGCGMPASRTWLMPEGTDSKTINARLPWVREAAAAQGFNVSDRLHIHAHGDKRGT